MDRTVQEAERTVFNLAQFVLVELDRPGRNVVVGKASVQHEPLARGREREVGLGGALGAASAQTGQLLQQGERGFGEREWGSQGGKRGLVGDMSVLQSRAQC